MSDTLHYELPPVTLESTFRLFHSTYDDLFNLFQGESQPLSPRDPDTPDTDLYSRVKDLKFRTIQNGLVKDLDFPTISNELVTEFEHWLKMLSDEKSEDLLKTMKGIMTEPNYSETAFASIYQELRSRHPGLPIVPNCSNFSKYQFVARATRLRTRFLVLAAQLKITEPGQPVLKTTVGDFDESHADLFADHLVVTYYESGLTKFLDESEFLYGLHILEIAQADPELAMELLQPFLDRGEARGMMQELNHE
jgi:hypothetical protein